MNLAIAILFVLLLSIAVSIFDHPTSSSVFALLQDIDRSYPSIANSSTSPEMEDAAEMKMSGTGRDETGPVIEAGARETGNSSASHDTVTLKALFTDLGESGRWKELLENALDRIQNTYANKTVTIQYNEYPTDDTRKKIIELTSNRSEDLDIVSVDQIWLGDLASKGLLSNLTDFVGDWEGASDWYQDHWDGGVYNNTVYGIWAWTDVRGIWYWKDILEQAEVDPNSLKTWDGYIDSAQKLNRALNPIGVNGTILFDTYYSQDMWFPYLWMLGGNIAQLRDGHPTKGTYWFPTYNSTEGVKALGFIRDQVDAGIKPDRLASSDSDEFAQKRIAVILGGSWIPGYFADMERDDFENAIGFIPMFPVPRVDMQSSTMMGGWELAIPVTSKHKELAWDLITEMLNPQVLGPWIRKYGYLPTQIPLGQGLMLNRSSADLPYYDTLISMISKGDIRPNIPEYPAVAEHINEAIRKVYYSNVTDSGSISSILNDAASKSARVLGW